MADGYTTAFNALKKIDEHNRPFQVLVRVEYEIEVREIQVWEDLVTGEKKETKRTVNTFSGRTVSWTPFNKTARGPYFLNSIEKVVKKFRKDDDAYNS